MFARCPRNSAAVTPGKPERDIIQIICSIFLENWENNEENWLSNRHIWSIGVGIAPAGYSSLYTTHGERLIVMQSSLVPFGQSLSIVYITQ